MENYNKEPQIVSSKASSKTTVSRIVFAFALLAPIAVCQSSGQRLNVRVVEPRSDSPAGNVGFVVYDTGSATIPWTMGDGQYDANCSPADREVLDNAIEIGQYAVSTRAFVDCVSSTMQNYEYCELDPDFMETATHEERVAAVLVAARNPNDINISCEGCSGPITEACTFLGSYGLQSEGYAWNRDRLDTRVESAQNDPPACSNVFASAASIAATTWHEVMHSHGFAHPIWWGPDCNYPERPYLIENAVHTVALCLEETISRSADQCSCSECANGAGRMLIDDSSTTNCSCVVRACEDFTDQDADGIGDACDSCPLDPVPDFDGDSHCGNDNCPYTANSSQSDRDADGAGDQCDNCAYTANEDQSNRDGDRYGDVCDNCPDVSNYSQRDLDRDGVGDSCDSDIDGDGIVNANDNCPYTAHPDQTDSDGDGTGDPCDDCDHVRGLVHGCEPLAWLPFILDGRIAGIAEYFRGKILGPWGPWGPWAVCEGECNWQSVREGYEDARQYLIANPDVKHVKADDFATLVTEGADVDREFVGQYLKARIARVESRARFEE